MKQCRFCFENVNEFAQACGHCGKWQPNSAVINSCYRMVAKSMAEDKMGRWLFTVPSVLSGTLLVIALIFAFIDLSLSVIPLVLAFVSFRWRHNLFQQHLYKTVFENAIELDKLLHEKLKEAATPKPQSFTKALVVMGILIIMTISNPSRQDFDHFQINQNGADALGISKLTRINLVVCSLYVYTLPSQDKIYFSWGVLGNFFSFNIKDSATP